MPPRKRARPKKEKEKKKKKMKVRTPRQKGATSKPTSRAACPVCGKTFTARHNIVAHLRVHNNVRPFKCDYPGCGKAFTQNSK